MANDVLKAQVFEKYKDLGALMTDDIYLDEALEALAFLESIPDEELLPFIKSGEETYKTMDIIEKAFIDRYEEFTNKKYDTFIFNVLDHYDFEDYIKIRFNISTYTVEHSLWR